MRPARPQLEWDVRWCLHKVSIFGESEHYTSTGRSFSRQLAQAVPRKMNFIHFSGPLAEVTLAEGSLTEEVRKDELRKASHARVPEARWRTFGTSEAYM